ncbi:MAG: hypothetical protein GXZ08_08470 [Tissierellia bacterium]|nr:hypothetical protein [Tissierellia bacterium]
MLSLVEISTICIILILIILASKKSTIKFFLMLIILGLFLLGLLYVYDYLFMYMYDCDGGILIGMMFSFSMTSIGLVGITLSYIIHIVKKYFNRN